MEYIAMRHGNEGFLKELSSIDDVFNPDSQNFDALKVQKLIPIIRELVKGKEITISHSPTRRTWMTAEIIARGIGYTGQLQEDELLLERLHLNRQGKGLSVQVTHMPVLDDALAELHAYSSRIDPWDAYHIASLDPPRVIKLNG